jgi:hypothetical protein
MKEVRTTRVPDNACNTACHAARGDHLQTRQWPRPGMDDLLALVVCPETTEGVGHLAEERPGDTVEQATDACGGRVKQSGT